MLCERMLRVVVGTILASLIVPLPTYAQLAGGTISGTVVDTSGALIAGAHVSIVDKATGMGRQLISNVQGLYNAPNLAPGNYEVTVTAQNFGSAREEVTVTVGGEAVANIRLAVGKVSASVAVNEQPPTVELGTSTLSATVRGQQVRDLPLNGRDWTQLATLEPGVKTINTQLAVGADTSRINRGFGNQLTIAGNRPQLNNYRVDGISINDYSGGSPGSVLGGNLGVDAIQEFSVVTTNASAEYAKTGGGVLNAVTRAGTNQFHGSVYEFLRNSALDARNYFDGPNVPPFRRNQFGASAGAPIRKDHAFVFADYEGLRQSLTTTNQIVVPSPSARQGRLANGQTIKVDPKVQPYLAIFPLPNGNVTGDTGTYFFTGKVITDEDFFTTRVDQQFSQKDSMYGTYTSDLSQTTTPDSFNFVEAGLLSRRHLFTVEESHLFTSNVVNISRFGFSRAVGKAPISEAAIDPLASSTALSFVPGRPVGSITVSGLSKFNGGVGGIGEYDNFFNSFQFYDDLFITAGAHSLKYGFALERIQHNQLSQGAARNGGFTFGSLQTFLTNKPTNFTAQIPQPILPIDLRQLVLGAYAQDDWRIRPNLTLNLGLRYEIATVPTETANRLATLVNVTDATPRLGSPFFQNPTLKNLSPRVGFSWDPFHNGKTAVRGGFGLYDVLPLTYQFPLLTLNSSPFTIQGQASTIPAGTFPDGGFALLTPSSSRVSYVQQDPSRSYVLQWNLNVQRQLHGGITMMVGYAGSHGVRQPFRSNDIDIVLPKSTPQGLLWPAPRGSGTRINPNVGQINALLWQVSSLYDALYLRAVRNITHGVRVEGSYTWSKSIDSNSSVASGGQFENSIVGSSPFLPKVFRGLADFDVRQNVVINYIWELPSPGYQNSVARLAAEGWQLGGIFQASSGQPFTPVIGGDPLGLNSSQPFAFPNRLRGPGCGTAVNAGNPRQYLKTECFTAPAPSTLLGNSGRNTVIGPGTTELDVSAFKTMHLPVWEASRLQFRAELFNVLNHPNFNPPDATQSATQVFNQSLNPLPNAGALTETSTTSRQVQFSLKLIW